MSGLYHVIRSVEPQLSLGPPPSKPELCGNTAVFAKSMAMLGNSEDNTALSRALSQLAELEDKMEQLHQEQAASDFFIFEELLADYIRLLGAVRVSTQLQRRPAGKKYWRCAWEHWFPAGPWLLTGSPGVALVLRDVWTSAYGRGSDGRRLRARCRRRERPRPSCCGRTSQTNSSRPKRRSARWPSPNSSFVLFCESAAKCQSLVKVPVSRPQWESKVTQYERDFDRVGMTVRKEFLRFEVRKDPDVSAFLAACYKVTFKPPK